LSPDREQAELLLRKAVEDQAVLVALAENLEIADAALGFHAQQAVEKALKAVLAARGDDFPWTHDLQLLLRRLDMMSVDLSAEVRAARTLAPWAVEYRYGETVDAELDRAATVSLVAQVLTWATAQARIEP
jgi:HEPN domain-containing protein